MRTQSERTGTLAVFATFFMNSVVLGNWIPRIPDVKVLLDLSATQLGVGLLSLALGTLVAFAMSAPLIKALGLRKSCMASMPLWALVFAAVPQVPGFAGFCLVLFVGGLSVGVLEVAMNSAADKQSRAIGEQIMSRAHGFWSLGSLAGALIGSAFALYEVPVGIHFAVVAPFATIFGVMAANYIPDFEVDKGEKEPAFFQLPSRQIFLLCAFPVGVMLVEGAFIDWSALFVKSILAGSAVAIGLIYAAFSLVMAITRLSGDWLVERYGPLLVARVSCLSATFGIALFALAPNVIVAFVAALFSGLGVAIVYPLAMTAAARRPGGAERNVAALSLFAFSAFMLAPPIIGFLTDLTGMRLALLLLAPLAGASILLTNQLKPAEPQP